VGLHCWVVSGHGACRSSRLAWSQTFCAVVLCRLGVGKVLFYYFFKLKDLQKLQSSSIEVSAREPNRVRAMYSSQIRQSKARLEYGPNWTKLSERKHIANENINE
jgi:hypothetical protein